MDLSAESVQLQPPHRIGGIERQTVVSRHLLGSRVDATSYPQTREFVAQWVASGQGAYVCVASVHSLMEAHDDSSFRDVLANADIVTPDGMPLVWGLRLLGVRAASRVYGPDLTDTICSWAAAEKVPIGFHGSTEEVLDRLTANMRRRYPGLQVAYWCSPPFRDLTDEERSNEIAAIRASGARVLFVGLGCPKQERWMAERCEALGIVLLGVGAAFDYLAGTSRRPPRFIQNMGLEWLFRLVHEPQRLWRRYLRHNPRFLVLFARQLIQTYTGEGT